VTIWTKLLELLTLGLATYALALGRLDIAAVALFFVCTQGAIFGPSKYGLLPELLPASKLSWGNGVIELWTLVAAIGGTLAGGFLAHHFRGRQGWSGILLLCFSLVGLLTSLGISRVPAADPRRHFEWNWPAAAGAICHALAWASRPWARLPDLLRGLRGHGICVGADVAGVVAQRLVLDGIATPS
jgi:MFS family permease